MKMFRLSIVLVFLTYLQVAEAIVIPPDTTVMAQNNFFGHITNITIPVAPPSWVSGIDPYYLPGDLVVGSAFTAEFALVDHSPPADPGQTMLAEYTFYGVSGNYTIPIFATNWTDPLWSVLTINTDRSLQADWNNGFSSDGLESTYLTTGAINDDPDSGGFSYSFDDYASADITGSGSFGWQGIRIDFQIGYPKQVPEPNTLFLIGLGLLDLIRYSRNKKASA